MRLIQMTVYSEIKGFGRHHEHIADFFSLLAVALFFATIWVAIQYQGVLFEWMQENIILHVPAMVLALCFDVLFIIALLAVGSSRFSDEEDDTSFRTFKGRRHGGPSVGTAFSNWLDHMEHVNKKHR
jgi:hypothetical protein